MVTEKKHYTKKAFARILMGYVGTTPRLVLDPAVGSGSLLEAALERWPQAVLVGFDVSRDAVETASKRIAGATVVHKDALREEWNISSRRGPRLIACNPPFSNRSTARADERIDVRFLNKCLEAAAPEDVVLFIVPYSLAARMAFSGLRTRLLHDHQLLAAASLPETAFEQTEALAVAIVLAKGHSPKGKPVRFEVLGRNAAVVKRTEATLEQPGLRFDPHYYVRKEWIPTIHVSTVPLSTLVFDVRRGTFMTPDGTSKRNGQRYLHTTDLRAGWIANHQPRFLRRYRCPNVSRGSVLVSRVGDGLWRKSALYDGASEAVASDCIYIIRTSSLTESAYLAAVFGTQFVQSNLRRAVQGITVPILPKSELLALPVPWLSAGARWSIAREWLQRQPSEPRRDLVARLNRTLAFGE